MRRFPLIAALVVALAVLAMIGLGFWQLHRAHWKEGLLARYQAAAGRPALDGIPATTGTDSIAFRHAHLFCAIATPPVQIGGPSEAGGPGFRNIAGCRLDDGRTMMADLGWTTIDGKPVAPAIGSRIEATGPLIPDAVLADRVLKGVPAQIFPVLVVLDTPLPGYQPSTPPSIADIPNNHLAYAVQWFLFAATAAIIFVLALRRRNRPSR